MIYLRLLVLSMVAVTFVAAMFLVGFSQTRDVVLSSEDGVYCGILSAAAWAVGSIGAPPRMSNSANIFAALFAALSLGFLAPAETACKGRGVPIACDLRTRFLAP